MRGAGVAVAGCSDGSFWIAAGSAAIAVGVGVHEFVDAAARRSGFEIAGGSSSAVVVVVAVGGCCCCCGIAAVERCGVDDVDEAEDYEGDAGDDAEDFEGGVDGGYLVGAGVEGHCCEWRWGWGGFGWF